MKSLILISIIFLLRVPICISNPDIHIQLTSDVFNYTCTVTGIVTKGLPHTILVGVTVKLGHLKTITDENGKFTFTHVPQGCYRVSVIIDGVKVGLGYIAVVNNVDIKLEIMD